MEKLIPCPLCGSSPRLQMQRKKGSSKCEYGYTCSNANCKESYFCIMYDDINEAKTGWNRTVIKPIGG